MSCSCASATGAGSHQKSDPTVDFLFSGTGKSQREVNLANGAGGECRLIVWSKNSCVFNAVLETGLKC